MTPIVTVKCHFQFAHTCLGKSLLNILDQRTPYLGQRWTHATAQCKSASSHLRESPVGRISMRHEATFIEEAVSRKVAARMRRDACNGARDLNKHWHAPNLS